MAAGIAGRPMTDPNSQLSEEQMWAIMSRLNRGRDQLIFYTLMRSGRRVSEVVKCLTPADINFKEKVINWTILKRNPKKKGEPKPEKPKPPFKSLLPADEELLAKLKRYIEMRRIPPHEPVFPICRQWFDVLLKKAAQEAGIYEVGNGLHNKPHAHLLRHAFAIRGANRAKSPADIIHLKELLGHSRLDTTLFYLRFNDSEKRGMLNRMWDKEEDQP